MWHLIFFLIGAAIAGETTKEQEISDKVFVEISRLPFEEAFPTPLPGLLYPRESESREVRFYMTVSSPLTLF